MCGDYVTRRLWIMRPNGMDPVQEVREFDLGRDGAFVLLSVKTKPVKCICDHVRAPWFRRSRSNSQGRWSLNQHWPSVDRSCVTWPVADLASERAIHSGQRSPTVGVLMTTPKTREGRLVHHTTCDGTHDDQQEAPQKHMHCDHDDRQQHVDRNPNGTGIRN